jgi:hypothetical protein
MYAGAVIGQGVPTVETIEMAEHAVTHGECERRKGRNGAATRPQVRTGA